MDVVAVDVDAHVDAVGRSEPVGVGSDDDSDVDVDVGAVEEEDVEEEDEEEDDFLLVGGAFCFSSCTYASLILASSWIQKEDMSSSVVEIHTGGITEVINATNHRNSSETTYLHSFVHKTLDVPQQ